MTKFINCVINDSKELKLIKIKVSDLRLLIILKKLFC